MSLESDFKFIRMWPREVFQHKNGNRLIIKDDSHGLRKPGVYILYREDEPYYVGKATDLFERLHDHANKMTDRYYPHWNYFSAFAFKKNSQKNEAKIAEIEGILISALPRVVNSATPRWPKQRLTGELRASIKKAQAPKAMAARNAG